MKDRVSALLFLMALLVVAPVSAKGTQEKDFQEAQGKDNFSQKIDLTNLTPGQYNLLVRTKDAAGNVSYVGPFNFYYDPTSDNPLMTVANPAPGARVGASQNVVGVASAPKGMALVEAQVDGGPWSPAKGKAFWSYYLNAAGMPDGLHQISLRGTDINGVVGPVVTVPFFLDQNLPAFSLTTQKSGDRVSGTVALAGTLADGNGLRSLDLSTDNQKTSLPLALSGDDKAVSRTFSTTLDTRKFADGPLVLWFHGVDGQGSEVRQTVLLFVDNTLPQVSVLSPPPNQGLHGVVRFVIQAEKTLGLKSLTAQVGEKGAPVSLAIVPGNPFHAVDLELPSTGSGVVPVIFEATDTAGKVGRSTYLARLNGDTDLPEIVLADPLEKASVRAPFRLTGTMKATDGPGAVLWALNGAAAVRQVVGASFDFPLPGLVSGTNKLTLTPVDARDRPGKPVSITFTGVLGPPELQWGSLFQAEQETSFRPGLTVGPDKKAKLTGTLTWRNPAKTVTWTLGDGANLPAVLTPATASAPATFALNFPADPPFGTVAVTVTAVDLYDQSTTLRSWVDITNLAKSQGPEGLAFADQRVGASTVVLTPESPLRGFFSSGKLRSAELLTPKGTVPASVVQVDRDDQYVTLRAVKDGRFEGVRLRVVSDKGRVYETELGTLMSDTAAPTIALSSPLSGTWVRENLRIDGKVSDLNGLTKLEWSIDDGKSWQQLDPPSGLGGAFTRNFSLPGPDNLVNLLIRATDTAERTGTVLTVVRRDTQAPQFELTLPTLVAGAKGTVYLVGRLKDEGALRSAEVLVNKKSQPLPLDRPFVVSLDAETAANPLILHALDWAGNETTQNLTLAIEPAAAVAEGATPPIAKPGIEILYPKSDLKGINGLIPVVGRVVNFTSPPQLSVKGAATGDQSVELSAAGYFTFEVNVSTAKSRSLAFSAVGEAKELASASLNLPYDAASELPVARFLPRTEKPVLTGNVSASGWIGDSRGTVSWIWQLDGGEKTVVTPDPAQPPVGTFLVDLGVPAVGPHKLTVIPVNAAGREGTPAVTEFVSTVASGPVEFTGFELGAPLTLSKESRLQGRIPSVNSWRKAEVRFADLAVPGSWDGPFTPLELKKLPDGAWGFDLAIPANLPYSRIGVVVRGEDSLGQRVEGRTLFHRIWPKDPATIQDAEGLVFADEHLDPTGRFETVPGTPLVGTFRGRPIKSVVLNPAVPGLEVKADGRQISVNAAAEGLYGPFNLVVTTVDNEAFTKGPITVFSDLGGPTLTWDVPSNADWIQSVVPVAGKVSDPSGVASLEVSTDAVSWLPVPVKAGVFDLKLPVAGPDGLTRILLRATDRGGHTTIDVRVVTKDASAPAWTLVAPPLERKVNGLTTLAGVATDLNPIVSVEYSDDGKVYKSANGTSTFVFDLDFASYAKLPDHWFLRTTDAAGNQAVTNLVIPVDQEADKPVVQIQTPAPGEVVRADFVLSGMAFDDDGVKSLSWRLDNGVWSKLDGLSSYQIPVAVSSLTDNEHTVEVQAEDIYGTKGNVFRSNFRVSLASPEAVLFTPEIDKTVSGMVGLVGASFDRNGIQDVQMSLDNGLTWNKAELRKKEEVLPTSTVEQAKAYLATQRGEWEWRFDSSILKDGTYLVMVRSTDSYGTPGLFTTLVNVDNSAPSLVLTTPADGEQILDTLDLEGRSSDNIKMVSLKAELRVLEGTASGTKNVAAGNALLQTELPITPTFNQVWNLGVLTPGWYNLRLEAKDGAGNATYVARNVRIEGTGVDKVEILYPQAGESLSGSFFIEGRVTSRTPVKQALVTLDGKTKVVVDVDPRGFFSSLIDGSLLEKGEHSFAVNVEISPTSTLRSEPRKVQFSPLGPWLKVVSHKSGSYVTQRPFVTGTAGWTGLPLDPSASAEETRAYRQALEQHKIVSVEASLDNGKTFAPAQGTEEWKFRLESLGLPDGPQPLLFRARFQDGSTAIQRLLVTISQTPPAVQLLTNVENGRFNGTLELSGFSTGEGEVSAVEIAVRQGDKAGYQVPSFIQGMYLDAHLWGATVWDVGLGLTFFQEAVKLQAQVGQTPLGRFWGTVAGAKLIASLAQLPMGYFFGPDWSWLSSSFGVGANFSTFSMNGNFLDFGSTTGVFLGGVVIQWEVARALLSSMTFFKSYSWYNEATVWFISSDVQAEAKWVFSTGFRVGLF